MVIIVLPAKMEKEISMESAVSSLFVRGKVPVDSEYWECTGRNSNSVGDANKTSDPKNFTEMNMVRGPLSDTGKAPISQASASSVVPFKEEQLKQLRAQCLVFLAFRNGLMPKKLHLEIALGNTFPKEKGGNISDGGHKEPLEHKGNEHFTKEQSSNADGLVSLGGSNSNRETESILQGYSSNRSLVGLKLTAQGS